MKWDRVSWYAQPSLVPPVHVTLRGSRKGCHFCTGAGDGSTGSRGCWLTARRAVPLAYYLKFQQQTQNMKTDSEHENSD